MMSLVLWLPRRNTGLRGQGSGSAAAAACGAAIRAGGGRRAAGRHADNQVSGGLVHIGGASQVGEGVGVGISVWAALA